MITVVAQVQSRAWELLHAVGMAKKTPQKTKNPNKHKTKQNPLNRSSRHGSAVNEPH